MVKLTERVPGVRAYPLAKTPLAVDTPVTLVTARQDDAVYTSKSMRLYTDCRVRSIVSADIPVAGYRTDCGAGTGSSGAGLLVRQGDGWAVGGLVTSGRGKAGCRYSAERCYAYALAIGPEIRAAADRLRRGG